MRLKTRIRCPMCKARLKRVDLVYLSESNQVMHQHCAKYFDMKIYIKDQGTFKEMFDKYNFLTEDDI